MFWHVFVSLFQSYLKILFWIIFGCSMVLRPQVMTLLTSASKLNITFPQTWRCRKPTIQDHRGRSWAGKLWLFRLFAYNPWVPHSRALRALPCFAVLCRALPCWLKLFCQGPQLLKTLHLPRASTSADPRAGTLSLEENPSETIRNHQNVMIEWENDEISCGDGKKYLICLIIDGRIMG